MAVPSQYQKLQNPFPMSPENPEFNDTIPEYRNERSRGQILQDEGCLQQNGPSVTGDDGVV
jgi:hypothetical protein